MSRFRVVYCGSNEVPVNLIKPILDEIDAEMVRRPKPTPKRRRRAI
jgi:hypothetical protein